MVSASQVTQGSFVGPEGIGHRVPSRLIKLIRLYRGSYESHAASAIGHSELTPVRLASQDSSASRKRRLAWAGVREKNNLLSLKIVREPGMEFPERLSRQIRDFQNAAQGNHEFSQSAMLAEVVVVTYADDSILRNPT